MKEILVMNREKARKYSYEAHTHSSIIVSITDPESERNRFCNRYDNRIRRILHIQFDDIDTEKDGYYPISDDDAIKITEFVKRYADCVDRIIVHCEAGVSRSAGCAAALMKYYFGNDFAIFDNPYYKPNSLVYKKVLTRMFNERDNDE